MRPVSSALHLDVPAAAGGSCGRCLAPSRCSVCAAAGCCGLPGRRRGSTGLLCRCSLGGPVLRSHAKHGLHLLCRELHVLQQDRQCAQGCFSAVAGGLGGRKGLEIALGRPQGRPATQHLQVSHSMQPLGCCRCPDPFLALSPSLKWGCLQWTLLSYCQPVLLERVAN